MSLVALSHVLNQAGGGGSAFTLDTLNSVIGNFEYVDEASDLPLVSGEHIASGAIEIIDNVITGLPPLFFNPIRIPDGGNLVIQAPLTLNFIVYLGAGGFLRCDDIGIFVQSNYLSATPGGDLIDMTSVTIPTSIVFMENVGHAGLSVGKTKGVVQVQAKTLNTFDRVGAYEIENATQVSLNTVVEVPGPNPVGPAIVISGDKTLRIIVTDGAPDGLIGTSYLNIKADINDNANVSLKDSIYGAALGGDFFTVGAQGSIASFADNSSTGSITSMADNGSGGTTITHTGTNPGDGRKVTQSGTTNYNKTYKIFNSGAGVYDIDEPFVGSETGTWTFNSVTVTTTAPHGEVDGAALQIAKSTNYNFGRVIFNASGSVFSIDDVVFNGDDAAGEWDSGSIKQNDPRVVCTGNGDQPDTSQLLTADISSTEMLTGTDSEALITTWVRTNDNQFTLNPPGQVTGTARYDGRDISSGATLSCAYLANTGNPNQEISFRAYRSTGGGGFAQVGSDIPGFLSNRQRVVTWTIGTPLLSGDLLQFRVFDAANNAVDITSASLIIRAFGQGV